MKISIIKDLLDATYLTSGKTDDQSVTSGFVGDLLSVVIGKAKEDSVWITIHGHINIVAVSSLVGISCIVVTEGYNIDDDTRIKAEEEEIHVLSTKYSSYQAVAILAKEGLE